MLTTIKKLFSPQAPVGRQKLVISKPIQPASGVLRTRWLGKGEGINTAVRDVGRLHARHSEAMAAANLVGMSAAMRQPSLRGINWARVHIVQVSFAQGTGRAVLAQKLPIGVRGTQLGAATGVRGRNGHLHAYALVYIG